MSLKHSDTEHKIDSEDFFCILEDKIWVWKKEISESSKVCLRNQKMVER